MLRLSGCPPSPRRPDGPWVRGSRSISRTSTSVTCTPFPPTTRHRSLCGSTPSWPDARSGRCGLSARRLPADPGCLVSFGREPVGPARRRSAGGPVQRGRPFPGGGRRVAGRPAPLRPPPPRHRLRRRARMAACLKDDRTPHSWCGHHGWLPEERAPVVTIARRSCLRSDAEKGCCRWRGPLPMPGSSWCRP